jgi:hypothetical protein
MFGFRDVFDGPAYKYRLTLDHSSPGIALYFATVEEAKESARIALADLFQRTGEHGVARIWKQVERVGREKQIWDEYNESLKDQRKLEADARHERNRQQAIRWLEEHPAAAAQAQESRDARVQQRRKR